jgi:hypothetical protein
VAIVVAGIIAAFFEPLPPLIGAVHSVAWTMLIEWFGLSIAGLALLSWMGITDMEFELSSTGIKARRIRADEGTIEELRQELNGMKQDNLRLRRLTHELREELSLYPAGKRESSEEEGEDD